MDENIQKKRLRVLRTRKLISNRYKREIYIVTRVTEDLFTSQFTQRNRLEILGII